MLMHSDFDSMESSIKIRSLARPPPALSTTELSKQQVLYSSKVSRSSSSSIFSFCHFFLRAARLACSTDKNPNRLFQTT
jgi:hypothetical protein